jgi:sugar-specific transcriptional regulator TrmB
MPSSDSSKQDQLANNRLQLDGPFDYKFKAYEGLLNAGFTPVDAVVYIDLLVGTKTVSDISRSCKISRTDAYRSLERLGREGFIFQVSTRPKRFEASPVDHTLGILHSRWAQQLVMLDKLLEESAAGTTASELRLSKIISEDQERLDNVHGSFAILRSRRSIVSKTLDMVTRFKKKLEIMTTPKGLARLRLHGILDVIEKRKQVDKALQIHLLSSPCDPAVANEEASLEEKWVTFRAFDSTAQPRFIICDYSECLLEIGPDDSLSINDQNEIAVWTDNRTIRDLCSSLFKTGWEKDVRAGEIVSPPQKINQENASRVIFGRDCHDVILKVIAESKNKLLLSLEKNMCEVIFSIAHDEFSVAEERGVEIILRGDFWTGDAKVALPEGIKLAPAIPGFSFIMNERKALIFLNWEEGKLLECLLTERPNLLTALMLAGAASPMIDSRPDPETQEKVLQSGVELADQIKRQLITSVEWLSKAISTNEEMAETLRSSISELGLTGSRKNNDHEQIRSSNEQIEAR